MPRQAWPLSSAPMAQTARRSRLTRRSAWPRQICSSRGCLQELPSRPFLTRCAGCGVTRAPRDASSIVNEIVCVWHSCMLGCPAVTVRCALATECSRPTNGDSACLMHARIQTEPAFVSPLKPPCALCPLPTYVRHSANQKNTKSHMFSPTLTVSRKTPAAHECSVLRQAASLPRTLVTLRIGT
jgi:hypothetical protein